MSDTYTILWREIKRYKKSKKGLVMILTQPIIWLFVIGSTFTEVETILQSVGTNEIVYINFLIPGVIVLTAVLT